MVSLAELPTRLATASFNRSTNILASFNPRSDVKSSKLDTGLIVVSVSPKAYKKHPIDNKRFNLSPIQIFQVIAMTWYYTLVVFWCILFNYQNKTLLQN